MWRPCIPHARLIREQRETIERSIHLADTMLGQGHHTLLHRASTKLTTLTSRKNATPDVQIFVTCRASLPSPCAAAVAAGEFVVIDSGALLVVDAALALTPVSSWSSTPACS